MSPYEEDIIYIPQSRKKNAISALLKNIYKNTRIWWCQFRAKDHSINVLEYFTIKFKVIISENKFAILTSTSIGIFSVFLQSSASLRVLRSALCGMVDYKPTTSAVTKIESSEIIPIFPILK